VLLVDRHSSATQLSDPLFVNVRANDFVPRFGETCACHKPDIATPNDGETQSILQLRILYFRTRSRTKQS
jgi:hypothetical protein